MPVPKRYKWPYLFWVTRLGALGLGIAKVQFSRVIAALAVVLTSGCAAWIPGADPALFEDPAEAGFAQARWDVAACEPVAVEGISGIRDVAVDRAGGWLLMATSEPGVWGVPLSELGSERLTPVPLLEGFSVSGLGLLPADKTNAGGPDCAGARAPILFTVGPRAVANDDVPSAVGRYSWCAATRRLTAYATDQPIVDRDETLTRARDVHPVAADRFFVANGPGLEPGFVNEGATWLRFPTANVVYFDGSEFKEAVPTLRMAGGVTADRYFLYVTEPASGSLRIYRLPEPGADALPLKPLGVLHLGTTIDRMEWVGAPGQELYIGAPPVYLDWGPSGRGWQDTGPHGVLRLRWREDGAPAVSVVLDDAERSLLREPRVAASIEAGGGTAMVVGSPTDARLVYCPAPSGGGAG